MMKEDQTARDEGSRREASTRPSQAWTKPILVQYGHLAKLTRGSSGTHTEAGGMKKACL